MAIRAPDGANKYLDGYVPKTLTEKYTKIVILSCFNLSELILRKCGKGCVDHPRMPNLMKCNGGPHRDILNGTDEVKAFESKEYVKLHNSTMAKVYWFKSMFHRLVDDKVATQHSNYKERINKFLEKTSVKLLGFLAILYTVVQGSYSLVKFFLNE